MEFDANKFVEHTEFHLVMNEPESPRALCGCRKLSDAEREDHENSEHGRIAKQMADPDTQRSDLECIARWLKLPRWFDGTWSDQEWTPNGIRRISGGWWNYRDGKPPEFVSTAIMQGFVDLHVFELGLDPALINAHLESVHSPEFERLDFERQLDHFRKK